MSAGEYYGEPEPEEAIAPAKPKLDPAQEAIRMANARGIDHLESLIRERDAKVRAEALREAADELDAIGYSAVLEGNEVQAAYAIAADTLRRMADDYEKQGGERE